MHKRARKKIQKIQIQYQSCRYRNILCIIHTAAHPEQIISLTLQNGMMSNIPTYNQHINNLEIKLYTIGCYEQLGHYHFTQEELFMGQHVIERTQYYCRVKKEDINDCMIIFGFVFVVADELGCSRMLARTDANHKMHYEKYKEVLTIIHYHDIAKKTIQQLAKKSVAEYLEQRQRQLQKLKELQQQKNKQIWELNMQNDRYKQNKSKNCHSRFKNVNQHIMMTNSRKFLSNSSNYFNFSQINSLTNRVNEINKDKRGSPQKVADLSMRLVHTNANIKSNKRCDMNNITKQYIDSNVVDNLKQKIAGKNRKNKRTTIQQSIDGIDQLVSNVEADKNLNQSLDRSSSQYKGQNIGKMKQCMLNTAQNTKKDQRQIRWKQSQLIHSSNSQEADNQKLYNQQQQVKQRRKQCLDNQVQNGAFKLQKFDQINKQNQDLISATIAGTKLFRILSKKYPNTNKNQIVDNSAHKFIQSDNINLKNLCSITHNRYKNQEAGPKTQRDKYYDEEFVPYYNAYQQSVGRNLKNIINESCAYTRQNKQDKFINFLKSQNNGKIRKKISNQNQGKDIQKKQKIKIYRFKMISNNEQYQNLLKLKANEKSLQGKRVDNGTENRVISNSKTNRDKNRKQITNPYQRIKSSGNKFKIKGMLSPINMTNTSNILNSYTKTQRNTNKNKVNESKVNQNNNTVIR